MALVSITSILFVEYSYGGIAQLVERCLCKADVSGSSPLTSSFSDVGLNELWLMWDGLVLRDEEGRSN